MGKRHRRQGIQRRSKPLSDSHAIVSQAIYGDWLDSDFGFTDRQWQIVVNAYCPAMVKESARNGFQSRSFLWWAVESLIGSVRGVPVEPIPVEMNMLVRYRLRHCLPVGARYHFEECFMHHRNCPGCLFEETQLLFELGRLSEAEEAQLRDDAASFEFNSLNPDHIFRRPIGTWLYGPHVRDHSKSEAEQLLELDWLTHAERHILTTGDVSDGIKSEDVYMLEANERDLVGLPKDD